MFGFRLSGGKGILQRSQLEQKRTALIQGGYVFWRKRWDSTKFYFIDLNIFISYENLIYHKNSHIQKSWSNYCITLLEECRLKCFRTAFPKLPEKS
ncbi:putative phage associated hypothetical protein [Neisseria meningitidis]|uniref:Uncharacterized protein n=1 Tax=Neisseria meningitidis TaxID=487 RepID=A0AAC9CNV5_NEIME|nr:putative phage associated hypothetical protein [Neisseria meningitidis]ANW93535.1 putative phage associated hypothetical protein [Neisseria meningitidis]